MSVGLLENSIPLDGIELVNCKPVYHEVLRLRADIKKQLNNSADGRR